MRHLFASSLAALTVVLALPAATASAQTEVRPRFMIAFDTSGSMTVDFNGIPTYGDGIPGATRGIDTDCDGQANDSRIFIAKQALRDLILTFGDIEYGLVRFPQFSNGSPPAVCNDNSGLARGGLRLQDHECEPSAGLIVGSVGDPTLNRGLVADTITCGDRGWDGNPVTTTTPFDLIPAACRPAEPRLYNGGSPTVCLNYLGNCPGVEFPGLFTFGDGDVLVGFEGFGWPSTMDNRTGILRWIDNRETAFRTSRIEGDYCEHSGSGDCELRAQGPTPLGGLLRAAREHLVPIRDVDPAASCRPYTVLLLTDGTEVCDPDTASPNHPINVARDLFENSNIRVYVIGLSIGSAQLDQIASAGGTGTAFVATDSVSLSAGLAQIVADSLLIEVCGNGDEDCDGAVDEGFVKFCDRPRGRTGLTECADPGETVCDGLDDNCNGQVDEGLLNACGACGVTPAEVCGGADEDCDGVLDEGGVCDACRPEPEICNNRDEDCDLRIDENVERPCGVTLGECRAGVERCTAGSFSGCTATGPTPEICDGLDNDCDGLPDDLTRPCGTDVGECTRGIERCVGPNTWGTCEGGIPASAERCDGLDNDCDGRTDEEVPGLGGACSEDRGECRAGTLACVGGQPVCQGGVEPSPEVCDGLDNDCDDLVDEGLDVGAPCGTGMGECRPGVFRCRGAGLVCEGGIDPVDERCDALDNDCDGAVDEAIPLGGDCGENLGACMPGAITCVDGRERCVGGRPEMRETCNCLDDDCDGEIDEDPSDGAICPGESQCTSCQCALPCRESEFGFTCPTGRVPQESSPGVCFCLADECDDAECAQETVNVEGSARCAPDSDEVGECVCRGIECTYACAGVVCDEGTVCDPRGSVGRCVEDSCRGLGCPAGQLCDAVTGACEDDPCESATCESDQACRAGACETSCADVECASGQRCTGGRCGADRCVDVACAAGEVCGPASGACVPDACAGGARCPTGSLCDPVEGCVTDPCVGLRCPGEQVCRLGECARRAGGGADAGTPRFDGGDGEDHVIAAGGCTCRVASAPSRGGLGGLGVLSVLGLLGVLGARLGRRRRRRGRSGRGSGGGPSGRLPFARLGVLALVALAAPALGGCEVETFCLSCGGAADSDAPPMDGGPAADARVVRRDGEPDDGGIDRPDGCAPGAFDDCNGVDDDCDGLVDEDVDTASDPSHCGGCGQACEPPHAFGECISGGCNLGACDVAFSDLDGDPDNGCEYGCTVSAGDDSLCDLLDNDCDGRFDEDADMMGDPLNCGGCGRRCRFAHAGASCEGGVCRRGACDPGFFDVDGMEETGCEYGCTPASPATERCDGLDQDCDGRVDEDETDSGGVCGSDVGECRASTEACRGGGLVCEGGQGPVLETCNSRDDDCDGRVDETTELASDPNNCGACGTTCSAPNAITRCDAGSCAQAGCAPGYVDLTPSTLGCDYECSITGGEVCDDVDNDCDGRTDEGLSVPMSLCNPNGECAGAQAECAGAGGWVCNYADADYQENETRCDGLDNDCDGRVDEAHPLRGMSCNNGLGECQRTGTYRCTADAMGVECSAGSAGTPTSESCDGLDNDCDGRVDEGIPLANIPTVTFNNGAASVSIFQYEASRPDATAGAAGSLSTAACSAPNVLPWTVVTWPQAQAACCALNDGGACPGTGQDGWRLCDAPDWQRACQGPAGNCQWSYATSCTSSSPTRCNGEEYDCDGSTSGDQDCVFPTGSSTFPSCNTNWGGAGRVYDLSGNVKEWTATAAGSGVYRIRGGAQNNLEDGRRCTYDFAVAPQSFAFPNTGFRCCHYDF